MEFLYANMRTRRFEFGVNKWVENVYEFHIRRLILFDYKTKTKTSFYY